jgi:hypothetical protein
MFTFDCTAKLLFILLTLLLLINHHPQLQLTFAMATESVASSTGSNHGSISISPDDTFNTFNIDFDPERDEAICSTLEIKRDYKRTILPLPELRDTAKKYGRWSPRRPQQDVIINTSALAQAFPDFSQAGSPNDTFSLEVPRGRKGKQHTTITSSNLEYTSDAKTPMVNLHSNLRLMQTPKQRVEPTQPIIYEDATRNNANVRNHSNNTQTHANTNTYLTHNKPGNPPQTHFATEQKENIPPIPQQKASKRASYTSNASRTISGDRRTLKDLHARVADESDGSFIGTERPASVTFQPKNTRFSKVTEKKQTQTHIFTPASNNGNPVGATQQSFFVASALNSASNTQTNGLPTVHHGKVVDSQKPKSFGYVDNFELPEDEEDIYEYARKLKAQVAQLEVALSAAHEKIDFIRADSDAAADLRVEASRRWEKEHDAIATENESLKDEIRSLKSQLTQDQQNATFTLEKQEHARKDQIEQMLSEKDENARKFQQQQSALQRQIDSLLSEKQESTRHTRTLQNQQSALRNQVDQLLREKDDTTRPLQAQQSALQNRVAQLLQEKEEDIQEFQNQQSILRRQLDQLLQEKEQNERAWQQKETAFQTEIQRRDEVVQQLTNVTQELKESTQKIDLVTTTRTSKSTSNRSTKQKLSSRNHGQDLPSKVIKQARSHMENIQAASANLHSNHRQSAFERNTRTQKDRAPVQALDFNLHQQAFGRNLPQTQNAVPSEQQNNTQISQEAPFDDNSQELEHTQHSDNDSISDVSTNYSSIVGHGFMPDIRQHLKNLREAKKQQLEAADQASAREDTIQSGRSSRAPSVKMTGGQHAIPDDTVHTIQSGRSSHAPSVRGTGGILKNSSAPMQEDLTGRFSIKSAKSNGRTEQDHTGRSNTHQRHRSLVEEDHTTKSNTSHRRHHSETTIHTTTRRQTDGEDMTSAYLVADIDAAKQSNSKERPVLSANARQALDGLCEHKHNRKNCVICLRLASFDTKSASKKTILVQKPVPVSKRASTPVPYEDEPTLRPAVAPGIALATVLKALEDEVAHLKMRQSEVHQAYTKHNASMAKRERIELKGELETLLGQIEAKSDQIYALYDVLEGQAQAGQEMSLDQVEVTLSKLESDIDEELPWEGIEESMA